MDTITIMDSINPETISRRSSYRRSITPSRSTGGRGTSSYKRQFSTRVTPPPDAINDDPEPSAPPLELMDKVRGYESASFESVAIPPPLSASQSKEDIESHRCPLPSIPHFTEKEVRAALTREVSTHFCYGTRAARDMAITDIKHSLAFHYTLETFTEKRSTCWAFEPYTGGTVDRLESGDAPFPWDIPSAPPALFTNHTVQLAVPHTSSVKICHVCGGVGRKRCGNCSGKGYEYCYHCHGDGVASASLKTENKVCLHCTGTGQRKCWKCSGEGKALCIACAGTGHIKCFIRLTINWTNHMNDHVVEKVASLNDDKIRSVTGEVICQEEEETLVPLTHFPDMTIAMASAQLIEKHENSFDEEKVLKQRHKVSIVPVAAVRYKWRRHEGMFHVYGFEQRVSAPDYPQTCFCCCCCVS